MGSTKHAPVVAGVDGSDSGAQAARWAAEEAELRGTWVVLASVDTLMASTNALGGPLPQSLLDDARADCERQVRGAAEEVRAVAPHVEIDAQIRTGNAAAELIELSWSAQLVVVGTRGHGEFTGLVVGSVARALVGHSRCSVLVVGDREASGNAGSVVVGVDGSASGDRALKEAFAEASARGTALAAVHSPQERASSASAAGTAERHAAAQEFLADRLGQWEDLHPEVPVRQVVGQEPPAQSLTRHSAGAQMLVVGTRGRGGFTGMLLGSVSHALLHTAPCPLLVAR